MGLKFGNFGVGRTETYIRRTSTCSSKQSFICFLILWLLGTGFHIYCEISNTRTLNTLKYIKENITELPYGQDGINYIKTYLSEKPSLMVHLNSLTPTPTPTPFTDPDFEISFPGYSQYQRQVQYCNWVEYI